jgi:hypothetical protein
MLAVDREEGKDMSKRDATKTLWVEWSKREADVLCHFPNKPDGGFVLHHFCNELPVTDWKGGYKMQKAFIEELKARGYDITTLKFSIDKLPIKEVPVPEFNEHGRGI